MHAGRPCRWVRLFALGRGLGFADALLEALLAALAATVDFLHALDFLVLGHVFLQEVGAGRALVAG